MSTEALKPGSDSFARFAAMFKPKAGNTLVVGSRVVPEGKQDRRDLYSPRGYGVDMRNGDGVDEVVNLEQPGIFVYLPDWDHVDCVSMLEHSRRPWSVSATIETIMASGSTLLLSVPFVWRIHAYPSDYWRFTPEGVRELFPRIEWKRLCLSHWAFEEVGEKRETQVPARLDGDALWMAKTEVWGFGVRV